MFLDTKSYCGTEFSLRKAEVNEDEFDEEIISVESMIIFALKNFASCVSYTYLLDDSPILYI